VKAVFFNEHGGPEVLKFGQLPDPQPGPGQVLVRLKASALNRLDIWVRDGWPGIKLDYPFIPGADGAGIVAGMGKDVDNLSLGDRVVINANIGCGQCSYCRNGYENRCRNWGLLGETRQGTYAEYVVVPEGNLYPLPENYPYEAAAAAGLVFHTAWHSLIDRGRLQAGETVLIVGASGGVNTASIQIAKLAGATVFVVGSDSIKLSLAESLGADYLINRHEEDDWAKTVYQLTGKRGVDVVVDNVGTTFQLSFRAAAKGARILTVGNTGGAKFEIDNRLIFGKHLSILGSTMGTQRDFAKVMDLIFSGELDPVLGPSFHLSEARAAQECLEAGEQMGKLTLRID
jgi:NADPH:quinone reductase-like Zn-dependent oxidoreductase